MDDNLRNYFDSQLEQVLQQLPPQIHTLLEEVPLVVDDFPTPAILKMLKVRRRDSLCGLYTGIPLTKRSVQHSGIPSDVIHIFREGICGESRTSRGLLDEQELRRQIRITILHEVGHHFGLTEQDLRELGYG